MRAAYASGVLAALHDAGFRPSAVYGTSAGGAIGAWFSTGQIDVGLSTWDRVGDRRLMSWRRALLGKPVLNGHLIYREMYPKFWKLDAAALRRAEWPVRVSVTDADTAETLYPDLREAEDPFVLLHATTALPILSDAPVAWQGRRLVDGGTGDPIPVARAIADGHRDIIVVANRVAGERRPEPGWAVGLVARRFPALREHARRHHQYHNDALQLAAKPPEGVRVRIIRPTRDLGVSRMTRDLDKLRASIEEGRRDGARHAREMGLTPADPPRVG